MRCARAYDFFRTMHLPGSCNRRRWLLLAILAALAPGLLNCATTGGVSADPTTSTSADHGSERRIASMIHEWFALLTSQTLESPALDHFVAQPPFAFSFAEGNVRSLGELRAWASNLRSTSAQVEYRIAAIRLDPAGEGLYQVRFESQQRALDASGAPHIAGRQHTWLVRDFPGEGPVILQIDERPSLVFPGTGPQIVCY